MSDIAIRFDGIMLAASLILAASIYFIIALCAAAVWLRSGRVRKRPREIARTSALFGVLYLAAVTVLVVHLTNAPTPVSGPDWLDWLSLPSLVLFVIGCVVIARRQPAPQ